MFESLHGEQATQEKWFHNLRNPLSAGETPVKASGKYLAYSSWFDTQSHIMIQDLKSAGNNIPSNTFRCSIPGNKKPAKLDFDFSPINDNLFAFTTNSTKISVVTIPSNNNCQESQETKHNNINSKSNVIDNEILVKNNMYDVDNAKVVFVRFHSCVESIVATASVDKTIKLIDIETKNPIATVDNYDINTVKESSYTFVHSMEWNRNGSLIALTTQNKKLIIFDPRIFKTSVIDTESFTSHRSRCVNFVFCNLYSFLISNSFLS